MADTQTWTVNVNELEAVLGLWVWSLLKSNDDWQRPLNRMVGIRAEDAGAEKTYLLFHKWIYRQTEARMVSRDVIQATQRLFTFDSNFKIEILFLRGHTFHCSMSRKLPTPNSLVMAAPQSVGSGSDMQ